MNCPHRQCWNGKLSSRIKRNTTIITTTTKSPHKTISTIQLQVINIPAWWCGVVPILAFVLCSFRKCSPLFAIVNRKFQLTVICNTANYWRGIDQHSDRQRWCNPSCANASGTLHWFHYSILLLNYIRRTEKHLRQECFQYECFSTDFYLSHNFFLASSLWHITLSPTFPSYFVSFFLRTKSLELRMIHESDSETVGK